MITEFKLIKTKTIIIIIIVINASLQILQHYKNYGTCMF